VYLWLSQGQVGAWALPDSASRACDQRAPGGRACVDRDPQLQEVPPSDVHGTGMLLSYLNLIFDSVLSLWPVWTPPPMGNPIAQPLRKRYLPCLWFGRSHRLRNSPAVFAVIVHSACGGLTLRLDIYFDFVRDRYGNCKGVGTWRHAAAESTPAEVQLLMINCPVLD